MTHIPMTTHGRRRGLRSAVALGVAAAVGLSGLAATPAFAAEPGGSSSASGHNKKTDPQPTLTVSPGQDLSPTGDTTLTLSGTGYATASDFGTSFGGAYLLFGVIDTVSDADAGSWAPSKRGVSGRNYDYAAGAGTYQSLINYPGNTTEPGLDYMDASGAWSTTLTIPGAQFTSQAGNAIDCLDGVTVCGVITIGAHGQLSSGVEVFTPVTFASDDEPTAVAPAFSADPANVSVTAGADAAFSVTVSGDPAPTLQWQSRAAGGDWADIADATAASYTIAAAKVADSGREFRVVATNEAGTATSATATLTVDPATPVYPDGAAVGTPLEGNSSYIVVTPGEEIDGSGSVTFTLDGYGFNTGNGSGTGGVYVGLGTKKNADSVEEWRKSKGGSSGPQNVTDFTYGSPILVSFPNPNGETGSVADGVMNADGSWTATLTIPGSQVPSFFSDTIDCDTVQCGVFSFGAHGVINAKNEAYTAITFAEPAVAATPTSTVVTAQPYGVPAIAGEDTTFSATVSPADAAGSVEFFVAGESVGQAEVEVGAASVTTADVAGGLQQVTAVFTPKDAAAFEGSTAAASDFRFVDLTPAVGTITVGAAAESIQDAVLNWSVANFVSFSSAPAKSVLAGDVVLADLPETPTTTDRANREFVFSGGKGTKDAAGNAIVSFTGSVKLASGSANSWTFTDPQVVTSASGAGYITAEVKTEFLGSLIGMDDDIQEAGRVVVSTFTGATTGVDEGTTSVTATPIFTGQFAAGSWSGAYTGGTFTNQVLTKINVNARSFFLQSGASADPTKAGRPIALAYETVAIPAPSLIASPLTGLDRAGDVVSVSGSSFEASARPSYDPNNPAGAYVSLGWIADSGWKPSAGAASATRVAVTTKWVQQKNETGGQYVRWELDANGRASFEFDFDSVSYADVLAKKPATGDYHLAVYSIGAGGVVQAANEFAFDVEFAPAAATALTVAAQATPSYPADFAGEDVTVSATVSPAVAGEVEFFSDGASLGTASTTDGVASLVTDAFTGGAHAVTATFIPKDAVLYDGSTAAAQTFRIVDLEPVIGEIEVGSATEQITDGTLTWSIANYFSAFFGSGFTKAVVSGDVELSALSATPTNAERAAQSFVFSGGTGHADAQGDSAVSFTGTVNVLSGSLNTWTFADPEVFTDAAGNGYITAEVTTDYDGNVQGPKRVVVSTFRGAQPEVADGKGAFQVAPIVDGQFAAGTWSGSFTGSGLTTQALSLIHAGVRGFFFTSGSSADATKSSGPIAVTYTVGQAPVISAQPKDAAASVGDDVVFEVSVAGKPAPALQWQSKVDGAWIDIADATSSTLTLSEVALAANGGQFRAVATNAFGSVTSEAAALRVSPVKPAEEPVAPTLGEEPETGGFELVSVVGHTVTIDVPADYENQWLGVFVHSDPQFLGWNLVGGGRLVITVPETITGAHHLSFVTADGELVGALAVTFADTPDDGGSTDPGTGGGSGSGSTDGDLATTGGELPLFAGGAALLLLLAGAALLFVRSRKHAAAE